MTTMVKAPKSPVNKAVHVQASPKKLHTATCPRCGRPQPDMVVTSGRLYTEPGHVLVMAYVCSGCEKIICWEKGGPVS
jgi:hypothetical protein